MGSNILSGDQLNFTRMGIASVDEIKVVLADILRCEIKPENLFKAITSCSYLMTGRNKLRTEQLKICCLSPPAIPNYNKFDVSLLYTLIRNLCPQLKPTQNWGKPPSITDLKIGDDIERLREFRNEMFAHLDSSKVEDVVFISQWHNLEQIFQRVQTFLNLKGLSVDYGKKLASIANSDFGSEQMENYKLMLQGMMHLLGEKDIHDGLSITIRGNAEIFCGEKTYFDAEIDHCSSSNNWPITWEKIQGNVTEQLDTNKEKYKGSSTKCLVMPRVLKEDEGEYRAVISRENNGRHIRIPSNSILLRVTGEKPTLTVTNDLEIPFGTTAVIHGEIQACPFPDSVVWQKSKQMDPKSGDVENIDVTRPKYCGSTMESSSPKLVINHTTFEDRLFYRLVVANSVGTSISSSTFLNVTGSSPSVFVGHDTDFQAKSVTLNCRVLCENSHQLTGLIWTKDNKEIDIRRSSGKYSGGDINNPSLRISEVHRNDAGIYQCRAINDVGSTCSKQINLGPPDITLSAEKNSDNGVLKVFGSIKSIPDAYKMEWKVQRQSDDEFNAVDIHKEMYKGTSVSLPDPVLVLNGLNFHTRDLYKIEVTNFIGLSSITDIVEKCQTNIGKTVKPVNGVNFAIYNCGGAKIRWNNLRVCLVKEIPDSKLILLKDSLKEIVPEEKLDKESLKRVDSLTEFVNFIISEGIFTERDVIIMQYLMRMIERPDLDQKCVEYATKRKERLCYFEEKKDTDRRTYVELHVVDDIENFTKLDSLIDAVAAIVDCDPQSIKVVEIRPKHSFIIVLEVEKKLAQFLSRKTPQELMKLAEFKIDTIIIGGDVIKIGEQEDSATPMTASGSNHSSDFDIEKLQKELDGFCKEIEESKKEAIEEESATPMTASCPYPTAEYDIEKLRRKQCELDALYEKKEEVRKEAMQPMEGAIPTAFQNILNWVWSPLRTIYNYLQRKTGSINDSMEYETQSQEKEKLESQFKEKERLNKKTRGSRADYGGYEMEFGKKEKIKDQFQKRESRRGKLKDMSLSKYLSPTVVITSFITVHELDSICHVSFVTSDKLWVSDYNCLLQVDSSGQVIQKKKIEIDQCLNSEGGFHTVTEDGELLFIDSLDRVQKMTLGGTITTLIKSDWRGLLCIHSSRINGDILLGCGDGVMRYDRTGQLRFWGAMRYWIRKIHYPMYITENKNGDICFSDLHKNAVVVKDKSGRHRFDYTGQQSQSGFNPRGICTDIHGQVLVCDAYHDNPSVHLLDQDGQFLCLLLTGEHGLHHPVALCVDDKHNFYLGEMFSNTITVFNYPQKKEKGAIADYNDYEMEFGKEEKTEGLFIKKESRVGELKNMSLSKYLSPTVVSTSSITVPELDSICHISFVTSDKLWVSDYKCLLQVDSSGHEIVKKRMETDIGSYTGFHTVTEDGDLLFINSNDGVQKITSDGTITTLIKQEQRRLHCIHSSRINGDILLGYRGGVMRYDRTGKLIGEALEKWIRWIYFPMYITENKNGDIWVSDEEVVVADKSGRHRFDYTGQKSQFYGFEPRGICTDILGQVLVCDYYNRSVHLLDQDGQFLCLLLTRKHGLRSPTALCVDDKHNLYLGQRNSNTIKVYRYLKETGDKNTSSELDVSKTKAVFKYLQETEKKNTSLMESK